MTFSSAMSVTGDGSLMSPFSLTSTPHPCCEISLTSLSVMTLIMPDMRIIWVLAGETSPRTSVPRIESVALGSLSFTASGPEAAVAPEINLKAPLLIDTSTSLTSGS